MNVIGETCQKKRGVDEGDIRNLKVKENFGFVFLIFYLTKR